jgi:hypothetical protein
VSQTDDSEVLYLQGGCYSRADDVEVSAAQRLGAAAPSDSSAKRR